MSLVHFKATYCRTVYGRQKNFSSLFEQIHFELPTRRHTYYYVLYTVTMVTAGDIDK